MQNQLKTDALTGSKRCCVLTNHPLSVALAVLMFVSVSGAAQVTSVGQTTPDGDDIVTAGSLPYPFSLGLERVGPRYQKAGKERITVTASLTDGKGPRNLKWSWQSSGQFEWQDGTKSLFFDGKKLGKDKGDAIDSDDQSVFDTIVNDSVEGLLDAFRHGGYVRYIGGRFREKIGVDDPSGPYYDVFVLVSAAKGVPDVLKRAQKAYWLDSDTKLLSRVRTTLADSTIVETRLNKWTKVGDDMYPSEIVRYANGVEQFRILISQFLVGAKADSVGKGLGN